MAEEHTNRNPYAPLDCPVEGERVTVFLQLLVPQHGAAASDALQSLHGRSGGASLATVQRRTDDTVLLRQASAPPQLRHSQPHRPPSDGGERYDECTSERNSNVAPCIAWFQFDHVTESVAPADGVERASSRGFGGELERVASCMPYALGGLLSNTNTSILWLNSPCPTPSNPLPLHSHRASRPSASCSRPLFDREGVSHSMGIRFLDDVVSELRKQPPNALRAYLSLIVWNHRDHVAVDLFSPVASATATAPEATPFTPSCTDGTLFPKAHEVCVCGGASHLAQRPSDVVPRALRHLVSWEANASVPLHATVVATVTVVRTLKLPNGSIAAVKTRLNILDVHYLAQVELLCRVGRRSITGAVTPWLQTPMDVGVQEPHPLPLVFFGIAMENRCVVTAAIPTEQELAPDAAHTRDRRASGSPALALHIPATLDALACLRRVVTGARGALEQLSLPPVDPEELPQYRLLSEVLRLRQAVNSTARLPELVQSASATQSSGRMPPPQQQGPCLSPSSSSQRQCVDALESAAAAASASWGFAADRVALLDEVRADLATQREALEQRRAWLMALPVTASAATSSTIDGSSSSGRDGGGSLLSLSERARLELLERTVALLEDENARLRRVFARDVTILRLDLAAAQGLAPITASSGDGDEEEWCDDENGQQQPPTSLKNPPRRRSAMGNLLKSLHRSCARFLFDAEQAAMRPLRRSGGGDGDAASVTDQKQDDTTASVGGVSQEIASLVEELRDAIAHDTRVFEATAGSSEYDAAAGGRSRTANDDGDDGVDGMPTEYVVNLVVHSLALGCGVSLPPPTGSDMTTGASSPSEAWWRRLVHERASAAVERYRLRHCADCLAMYTDRLMDTLSQLTADVLVQKNGADNAAAHRAHNESPTAEKHIVGQNAVNDAQRTPLSSSTAFQGGSRSDPSVIGQSFYSASGTVPLPLLRGTSTSVLLKAPSSKGCSSLMREVEALVELEAASADQRHLDPRIAQVYEPKLLLAVERCRSVAHALRDVARGVCDIPSSLRRVEPQPLGALVESTTGDSRVLKNSLSQRLASTIHGQPPEFLARDDNFDGAGGGGHLSGLSVAEVGISLDKLLRGRYAVLYSTDEGLRSGATAAFPGGGANAMRGSTKKGYFSNVSKMAGAAVTTKASR